MENEKPKYESLPAKVGDLLHGYRDSDNLLIVTSIDRRGCWVRSYPNRPKEADIILLWPCVRGLTNLGPPDRPNSMAVAA